MERDEKRTDEFVDKAAEAFAEILLAAIDEKSQRKIEDGTGTANEPHGQP